jgi:HK97 gp10 family phage protein
MSDRGAAVSDTVKFKVTGLAEAVDKLRKFGPKVTERGLRATNYAGAKVLLKAIQAAAPVGPTGRLKASIVSYKRRGQEGQITHTVGLKAVKLKYGNTSLNRRLRRVGRKYEADGPAFYGKFVEFGSSRMGAKPFLRPAVAANVQAAVDAMKARLAKAVEDAAKS